MRPHEEEWEIDPTTQDPLLSIRRVESTEGVDREVARRMTREEAQFIVAAPEMARRLLALVRSCESCRDTGLVSVRCTTGSTKEPCPTCDDDRAMLRRAGVLP